MAKVEISHRKTGMNQRGEGDYYMVTGKDGKLRCSCGAELIQNDDNSLVCPGGYPIYRPQDGDIVKDKHGNILLRHKPHGNENEQPEGQDE